MNPLLYAVLFLQTAQQVQLAGDAFRAGSAYFAQGDLSHAHAEFAKVIMLTPKVAAGHSAFGAVLLAEGNGAGALAELELAHHLDPNDATTSVNLATAYSQEQRYKEALACFGLLPAEVELPPEAVVAWATALAATGDLIAAASRLNESLAANPQSAVLHDALGTLLAQQQHYGKAQSEFEAAIKLDAGLAAAHLHLGSLYLLQQNSAMAVTELTAAAMLAPNDVQVLLQLGRAQTAARQEDAAIATLSRAHQLAPASPDAGYALALALQNGGRNKEALPLFAAVAAARPNDGSVLTNYGLALVQTGDAKGAIPLYERALKLDGASPVLDENLGVAYLQQSDLDHAIRLFQAGLALPNDGAPLTAELHYDLGLAWKLQDKLPEAIAQFEKAQQVDPSLPDPPYTLGVLYMQTGKLEQAAAEMEQATAMRPENGEAWSILGNIYKQMNQPDKAIHALRHAIQLLPNQPSPHISLAAILAQQGNREGAAAERKIGADLSRVAVSRQRADFALKSGAALLQQGKIPEAIEQLRSAVIADPLYAAPHRVLGEALAQQGKLADAAVERRRADALDSGSK